MNNDEWRHFAGLKNGLGFVLDPDEGDSIATQFGVRAQLAGQTRLTVSATEALAIVRDAWRAAADAEAGAE